VLCLLDDVDELGVLVGVVLAVAGEDLHRPILAQVHLKARERKGERGKGKGDGKGKGKRLKGREG